MKFRKLKPRSIHSKLPRFLMWGKAWIIICLMFCGAQTSLGQPGKNDEVRHLVTESGVEFGLWGGLGQESRKPLIFILANTIDGTLGNEYFRQCGNRLARDYGWLCVSLDLPYHGKRVSGDGVNGLQGWAEATKQKIDFVKENNNRMREILNFLIRRKNIDTSRIVVCGTSRGGYLALQFAVVDPRVTTVIAYCPVTDLLALREFKGLKNKDLIPTFKLDTPHHLEALSRKKIWISIGDRDQRVGTDNAIRLAREITGASINNRTTGETELDVMYEPKGHTTPAGAVDRSINWLLERNVIH